MLEQPPLLTNDPELPSPLFKPRPGWGGRFKTWFDRNAYTVVFRTLMLGVSAVVVIAVARAIPTGERQASSPSPIPQFPAVTKLAAQAGQGMTHLAAQALDVFLASRHFTLTPAEHLFAVDTLARNAGWRPLTLGEEVPFNELVIADTYARAKALTPSQRAAWARYLR